MEIAFMIAYLKDILFSEAMLIALGLAIAYIPVFHKTLQEEQGLIENVYLKRIFKNYPRPTGWGWLFLFIVALTFYVSYKKDRREQFKEDAVNASLLKAEEERKKADTAYMHALIRSDTLHSQQYISFYNQLDKWGLTIENSLIVKQSGNILIWINDINGIQITHNDNATRVEVMLINYGSAEAFNLNAEASMFIKDKSIWKKLPAAVAKFKDINLAKGGVVNHGVTINIPNALNENIEKLLYIKGTYQDGDGKTHRLLLPWYYSAEKKRWGKDALGLKPEEMLKNAPLFHFNI